MYKCQQIKAGICKVVGWLWDSGAHHPNGPFGIGGLDSPTSMRGWEWKYLPSPSSARAVRCSSETKCFAAASSTGKQSTATPFKR